MTTVKVLMTMIKNMVRFSHSFKVYQQVFVLVFFKVLMMIMTMINKMLRYTVYHALKTIKLCPLLSLSTLGVV